MIKNECAYTGVIDAAVEKIRMAMLGGSPIVYVKTDSDVTIRRIVSRKEQPLVVLRCGEKAGAMRGRPLHEWRQRTFVSPDDTPDYVPCTEASEIIKGLDLLRYPRIWTLKMPDGAQTDMRATFRALEAYVNACTDPDHPAYEALSGSIVLLYASQVSLSPMLRTYATIVEIDYPDEQQIIRQLQAEADEAQMDIPREYLSSMAASFSGFTEEEITQVMGQISAQTNFEDDLRTQQIIRAYKEQKLEGGVLRQCSVDGEIGGMENYRLWLRDMIKPLAHAGEYRWRTGNTPPKGVLMCGIPGCGKSDCARYTARTLGLPLLRMDIGSLMHMYQGESERELREALKLAETMAPCVLWIDEMDKGFSEVGRDGGSGSFMRMFGYLLSWMQDNVAPVFIFATANDIGGLPKEFFRSGRFEARYAVYLPTERECAAIISACMKRAAKNTEAAPAGMVGRMLFESGCTDEHMLRGVIRDRLVVNGRPRIVIGSDLQQVVSIALRRLEDDRLVTVAKWKKALADAMDDVSAYGDSEENLEHIAASYCRLLRKNFKPTSDEVLFRAEDYRGSRCLTGIEAGALAPSGKLPESAYDRAVYECLLERINEIAPEIERYERERLVRR